MINKNLEIANLVFNWLKCLEEMVYTGHFTIFDNQEEVPISLEYFQSKFTKENIIDVPENADSHTHIYINCGLIQLIDDETWHNQDYDYDMSFSLDLPDIYFTAYIY